MKLVILLIFIGMFTTAFAQEESFEDQYVGIEEYSKINDKLDSIENNLEIILENQFVQSEENIQLTDRLDGIENNLEIIFENQSNWDFPNWVVFLVGIALAIGFFSWQKNKERTRRNSTKRSFVWALYFIMNNLPHVEKAVKDYYDNGENDSDKQKVENENSRLKMGSEHIRFYLSISTDVLNEDFVRDVDFLCAVLDRRPIVDDLQLDQQRFETIRELDSKFIKNELKTEKGRVDAKKLKEWKDELEKITVGE